jgi:hypothetical protein
MITQIQKIDDVKTFVKQLVEEELNYHPDDDFTEYISIHTGQPTYSEKEARVRNELNNQCFVVCERLGEDIYNISQEIFLIETGLDKYIPLPSQVS